MVCKLPPVIPVISNNATLMDFVKHFNNEWAMIKIGDINSLPEIIQLMHNNRKKVLIHHDSIDGLKVGRSSIHYLAKIGADAISVNKTQCVKMIKDENMLAVLCVFILDSAATATSIRAINTADPDFAIVMPSTLPTETIHQLKGETRCPVYGGGLCKTAETYQRLMSDGLDGVMASAKALWDKN